jgi:hypothetical protein
MSYEDVLLPSGKDDQVSPEILDASLTDSFRSYHIKVANLDVVESGVNLSQASRNRIKQGRMLLK